MLRAGCVGYLVKDETIELLPEAIHRAAEGQATLAPAVIGPLVDELVVALDREEERAPRTMATGSRIEEVLGAGGPDLVFQPIVDLATGEPVGLEALARFPFEPYRAPDLWFAEAAELGRGVELEMQVVQRVCDALPLVPEHLYVGCNVSPSSSATDQLAELVAAHGCGDRLVLEVTEHVPIGDYEPLIATVARLRSLGVRLSVDDVGAGFASLRHVLRLHPDFVKLDISLIRDIQLDHPRQILAQGIIAFAGAAGATVIAEGVETEEEAAALRGLGVSAGQGYYWARPLPLESLLSPPRS